MTALRQAQGDKSEAPALIKGAGTDHVTPEPVEGPPRKAEAKALSPRIMDRVTLSQSKGRTAAITFSLT